MARTAAVNTGWLMDQAYSDPACERRANIRTMLEEVLDMLSAEELARLDEQLSPLRTRSRNREVTGDARNRHLQDVLDIVMALSNVPKQETKKSW